jgi:hypothetical protein
MFRCVAALVVSSKQNPGALSLRDRSGHGDGLKRALAEEFTAGEPVAIISLSDFRAIAIRAGFASLSTFDHLWEVQP